MPCASLSSVLYVVCHCVLTQKYKETEIKEDGSMLPHVFSQVEDYDRNPVRLGGVLSEDMLSPKGALLLPLISQWCFGLKTTFMLFRQFVASQLMYAF